MKYLYCAIRNPVWEPDNTEPLYLETRRYRVLRELKTQVCVDPDYLIRVDEKWVKPTTRGEVIDRVFKAGGYFVCDGITFETRPDAAWPGRKPKPTPIDERLEQSKQRSQEFDDLLRRIDPAGAARADAIEYFGFEGKPSEPELRAEFRRRSIKLHPDSGGDCEAFRELQRHRDALTY